MFSSYRFTKEVSLSTVALSLSLVCPFDVTIIKSTEAIDFVHFDCCISFVK